MADDSSLDTPPSSGPKKSMASLLVPVLLTVNMAGVGVVAFLVLKQSKAQHAEKADDEEKDVEDVNRAAAEDAGFMGVNPPVDPPGPLASLEPFVVNLNEPGKPRYLKATFELELVDAEASKALDVQKAVIRDDLLRYFSNLSMAETAGDDNKTTIRNTVKTRINKLLDNYLVKRVFFLEFVVQ